MSRLLPAPLLSVGLLVLWLLLMQSLSLENFVLGGVLAVFWPAVTVRLRPAPVKLRRPLTMVRLFGRVMLEMLRSNAAVAMAIILGGRRTDRSRFVAIPLELRDPNGLAVLAMIITFTPGTAWIQLSADGQFLLLHVLAIDDEAQVIAHLKNSFERPLMEIFQ